MMMNRLKVNVVGVMVLGFMSFAPVYASSDNNEQAVRLHNIQGMQAKSINQGINLGKLTPREASRLASEQSEISALEKEMKKDGKLTHSEFLTLFSKLESSRENIIRLTRNSISIAARTTATMVPGHINN